MYIMGIKDDYFILAAWILIPMALGIIVNLSRVKTMIPYIITSVLLLCAIIAFGILTQIFDGESYIGAAYGAFFFSIAFVGFQLGAGIVWLIRCLRPKKRKDVRE